MVKIPLPEDPDEYKGAPLSLGSEHPVPTKGRVSDQDVADVLAKAIVDQGTAVRKSVLEYLDRCARSKPSDERARAAEIAVGLIQQAQQRRSTG